MSEQYESKVTAVTVNVTQSIKIGGDLVSITLGETKELTGATDFDALVVRQDMADVLAEQGQEFLKKAKENVPAYRPAPAAPYTPAAPAVQAAQATVQAAFPAPAAAGGGWMSVASRFGDGDIKFLPCSMYPTAQLEAEVFNFLAQHNLDSRHFKVWDNRPGPRGMEAGVASGAVAAIKLVDGAPGKEQMGNNAIARVKFNNDGSLYVWLTKEFEAALKFIAPSLGSYMQANTVEENAPW